MSDAHVSAELVDENTLVAGGVVFVRRRVAGAIVTADEETDCATGYCKCSVCGKAIDLWDSWCRHCGAKLGGML